MHSTTTRAKYDYRDLNAVDNRNFRFTVLASLLIDRCLASLFDAEYRGQI